MGRDLSYQSARHEDLMTDLLSLIASDLRAKAEWNYRAHRR